jgi:hypothetical protein
MITTPGILDDIQEGCGPDCIYIDGACRCFEGGPSTSPDPEWVKHFPLELLPF